MHPAPKVGDRLLAAPVGFRDLSRIEPSYLYVVRVGRKYLYANTDGDPEQRAERYALDGGYPDITAYRQDRVYTQQEWDEEIEAHALLVDLRRRGWESPRHRPSVTALRAMLAALEADEP